MNTQHRTSKQTLLPVESTAKNRVFDLEERLLEVASAIIDRSEALPNTCAGNHVGGQLLRCGTSPFSNHGEAESAESAADFVHKLRICLKELRETRRWLRLIARKGWMKSGQGVEPTLSEVEELIRTFAGSIRTASRIRVANRRTSRSDSEFDVQS